MKIQTNATLSDISDDELSHLLHTVYVDGGYTSADVASELFVPDKVRQRGTLICARTDDTNTLAGMVMIVPHTSDFSFLAKTNECEIQLLGVLPAYRGEGVGKELMQAAIALAKESAFTKVVLATQHSMTAAHGLYELLGFCHVPDRDYYKKGKDFKVYQLVL